MSSKFCAETEAHGPHSSSRQKGPAREIGFELRNTLLLTNVNTCQPFWILKPSSPPMHLHILLAHESAAFLAKILIQEISSAFLDDVGFWWIFGWCKAVASEEWSSKCFKLVRQCNSTTSFPLGLWVVLFVGTPLKLLLLPGSRVRQ